MLSLVSVYLATSNGEFNKRDEGHLEMLIKISMHIITCISGNISQTMLNLRNYHIISLYFLLQVMMNVTGEARGHFVTTISFLLSTVNDCLSLSTLRALLAPQKSVFCIHMFSVVTPLISPSTITLHFSNL